MKQMTILVSLLVVVAIVTPAVADFTDDFESYTAGNDLTSPWVTVGGAGMVASDDDGYGGGQGAYGNDAVWHVSERPTNYDTLESIHKLTWKARLSSQNGLARLTAGAGNGVQMLLFEMDQRPVELPSIIGWPGGSVPVDDDVWYTMTVYFFKDAVGDWSWLGSYEAENGPTGSMGSGNLPLGWEPEKVQMQGIWAWEEAGPVSSIDDVSFEVVTGSSVTYGFSEDFESYPLDPNQRLGAPWKGWDGLVVNDSGWNVSKGVHSGDDPNWHTSYRPTNYDRSETDHRLRWKARLSSFDSVARLTAGVGSPAGMLWFEMNQVPLTIEWVGGSVPVTVGTWYEMMVEVEDGGASWTWQGQYRAWGGSAWESWLPMGSGTAPAGWSPGSVGLQSVYAFDETIDAAIDDVVFEAITDPTVCSEAIEQGYGLKGDVNEDCYVNLEDIAEIVENWVQCVNPADEDCGKPWLGE